MKHYGVDKKGFINTEVGLNKVKPVFSKAVVDIKKEIVGKFDERIFSVYLYGSVATGKARVKISDLDLLFVLKKKPTSNIKKEVSEFQDYLTTKYSRLFRDVGIVLTYAKEVENDMYGWGCFIKHLCVYFYGENIGEKLPRFKPSRKVAKGFNGDFDKYIKTVLGKLATPKIDQEVRSICQSSMKKIVRTGFSIVMDKEKSWTTDLKKSCEIFSKYYPERSVDMKKAFGFAQRPTADVKELVDFLKSFGGWIAGEVRKKL